MGTKKKEALVQFNKTNILNAAKKLFEEKGIEQTTVDDIAKEADYSKSTVYVYFKSKDEILSNILLEHFILLRDTFRETSAKEKDLEKCYELLVKDMIDLHDRYPFYFERLQKEIEISEEDFKAQNVNYQIYKVGEEINDLIANLLQQGIELGLIREDIKLVPTVMYLWSTINCAINFAEEKKTYLMQRLQMSKADYLKHCMEMLLNGLRR